MQQIGTIQRPPARHHVERKTFEQSDDGVDAGNLGERVGHVRRGVVAVHRLQNSRHVPLLCIWPARDRPACGLANIRGVVLSRRGREDGSAPTGESDLLCEQKYLLDISSSAAPDAPSNAAALPQQPSPVGRRGGGASRQVGGSQARRAQGGLPAAVLARRVRTDSCGRGRRAIDVSVGFLSGAVAPDRKSVV